MNEKSDPRTERLLRLAESVSEGSQVDWESETGLDLRASGAVEGLRDLAAVVAAHRKLAVPQDPPPPPRPPAGTPETWGPLRLERKVGQGLSGEVHAAVRAEDGARVLLFLRRADWGCSRDLERRFAEERDRLTGVRQANLVRVLGGGSHAGRLGLYTEDVTGVSLEERLIVAGALAPEAVVAATECLIGALRALHAAGLFGRDLRPGRILERAPGDVALLDLSTALELPPHVPLTDPQAGPDGDLAALIHLISQLRQAPAAEPARAERVRDSVRSLYGSAPGSPGARRALDDLKAALGARAAS